jgi:phosphoribosylglycinamide formyltransferase 1
MAGTAPEIQRIVTLSSGRSRGSNLLAIYRFFSQQKLPVQLAAAVFTNSRSPAYLSCQELGITTKVISCRDMKRFESEVLALLRAEKAGLVALCGFMKLLSAEFICSTGIPVLNVHPALLPQYGGRGMYGMAVHQAVFEAQEERSGATIHMVDPIYDHGQILMQKAVDISACSCPQEIAVKVLKIEHEIYPRAIYAELNKA